MTYTIYAGSSGTITLYGLTLQPGGTPVTGATVTATLTDHAGVTLYWSAVTMTSIGGGNYTYSFTASSLPPVSQIPYPLTISITSGGYTLVADSSILIQNFII
jgi:hypothetical protein